MFLTRSEHDIGVNTFSREGRLFQIEYAIEAVKLGSTAVGIRTNNSVVLAVEKKITSPLMVPGTVRKIMELDTHVGCAVSGLPPDARMMVDHARVETQNYWFTYNEKMKIESVTQAMCDLSLNFSEEGKKRKISRPFGIALLIAGKDENGCQLFHADPSGTMTRYDAMSIGSGQEGAKNALQEEYEKNISHKEAETLALKVLKEAMEEKIEVKNVEMAFITDDTDFRHYTSDEVAEIIARVNAAADNNA